MENTLPTQIKPPVPGEAKITLTDIKGPASGFDGPVSFYGLTPEDCVSAAEKYGYVTRLIAPDNQRMIDLVKQEMEYYLEHGVDFRIRTRPSDGHREFILYQLKPQDLTEIGYGLMLTRQHPTSEAAKKQLADEQFIQEEWERTLNENQGRTRIIWGLDEDYLLVKEKA